MHGGDFRRDGRSDDAETDSGPLQYRGRWRIAAGGDGGRVRAPPENGRGISQGAGRGHPEVFAANGARRNLERLRPIVFYHQSEFHDASGYKSLAERLEKIDKERGTGGNRLFYLAVAPDQFEPILKNLKDAGLNKAREGSWARVIVEKPFGTDLASARKLNAIVRQAFSEDQTYRIDHFLGKETAQNILVLRFANAIFEPIWNGRYVDHIQITAAETLGVEGRAGYYEGAGALRDMVQNHLLQLLCLVAMEPPTDLGADSIRDEKVKIVKSLRRMSHEAIAENVVRGQYAEGAINGKTVPGYRSEKNVKPDSKTETFVALRVRVDDWRLADVPIYIRVGKRLPKSGTEISVHFKKRRRSCSTRNPFRSIKTFSSSAFSRMKEFRCACRRKCPAPVFGSSR